MKVGCRPGVPDLPKPKSWCLSQQVAWCPLWLCGAGGSSGIDGNEQHERARQTRSGSAPASESVGLYDMVFALNLASSFGYGLLVCVIKRIDSAPPDDLYYFFLRAAARINDALLLSPGQVAISDMERHFPTVVEQLSRELVLLVSVFAAMTSVYLLLKMIAGTRLHRVITTRFLGPSLLFAAPLSCTSP